VNRLSLLPLAFLAACATAPPSKPAQPAPSPVVVLLTDFGLQDDAVGLMRGVIHDVAPRSAIADLTHSVPAFDVEEGARLLADAPGIYPDGSVFCVVVDPGVGTERRAVVGRLPNGTLLVAPDNGVLTLVARQHGPLEVRAITNQAIQREALSDTFHGRDVFAPVAAHLAAGVPFPDVGPPAADWIRLEVPEPTRRDGLLSGRVTAIDRPFGNVWTDLPPAWLEDLGVKHGDTVEVELTREAEALRLKVPYVPTFGAVPEGRPLLYINSRGKLGLALNMGDFAATHGIARGVRVHLRR
jgi:S-adenosylmethionine hydrolase